MRSGPAWSICLVFKVGGDSTLPNLKQISPDIAHLNLGCLLIVHWALYWNHESWFTNSGLKSLILEMHQYIVLLNLDCALVHIIQAIIGSGSLLYQSWDHFLHQVSQKTLFVTFNNWNTSVPFIKFFEFCKASIISAEV